MPVMVSKTIEQHAVFLTSLSSKIVNNRNFFGARLRGNEKFFRTQQWPLHWGVTEDKDTHKSKEPSSGLELSLSSSYAKVTAWESLTRIKLFCQTTNGSMKSSLDNRVPYDRKSDKQKIAYRTLSWLKNRMRHDQKWHNAH